MNHGTTSAYEEGCRCSDCRQANARRKRVWYSTNAFRGHLVALPKALEKYGFGWMLRGLCRRSKAYSPDLWYSEHKETREVAKGICQQCPVLGTCYNYAIEAKEPWGIWGGADTTERAEVITGKRRRKPIEVEDDAVDDAPSDVVRAADLLSGISAKRRKMALLLRVVEDDDAEGEVDSL